MVKIKGLGRGLDALLGGDSPAPAASDAPTTLPVTALLPGKYQPRTRMDPGFVVTAPLNIFRKE